MNDKNSSSAADGHPVALHPHAVIERLLIYLSPHIVSKTERAAVELIGRRSLPPAINRTIGKSATVLFASGLIDKQTLRAVRRVTRRARSQSQMREFSIVEYPVPYALELLYETGRDYGLDGRFAVETVFELVGQMNLRGQFTGIMFHKHAIALRDVILEYWDSFSSPAAHQAICSAPFTSRIKLFAHDCLDSAVISETTRVKLQQTIDLLDGNLTLGGRSPRGESSGRSNNKLESEVTPSNAFARANPDASFRQSTRIEEPCPDDNDSDIRLEHPDDSTAKDRQAASRREQNGFARKNARSPADMSGCSRVTYTDFLNYAKRVAEPSTYALVWISSIPAVDVRRPFALKRSARQRPDNDGVLVDIAHSTLEYNVLRRKKRDDQRTWESCGLMCLPVPAGVIAGLKALIKDDVAAETIQEAEKLSKKFSRSNAGQTPTPTRSRSAARTHFAPLGFTELEFGAISGRLPPSIRALSHYYHSEVSELQRQFRNTYSSAIEEWGIELPELRSSAKRPAGRRNYLFCLPSEPIETVAKILSAIASAYENDRISISPIRQISDLERLISAANHHSLALYVFQEMAAGLRPTGNVAEFTHATCVSGSLIADKASAMFAERSFSPLSMPRSFVVVLPF